MASSIFPSSLGCRRRVHTVLHCVFTFSYFSKKIVRFQFFFVTLSTHFLMTWSVNDLQRTACKRVKTLSLVKNTFRPLLDSESQLKFKDIRLVKPCCSRAFWKTLSVRPSQCDTANFSNVGAEKRASNISVRTWFSGRRCSRRRCSRRRQILGSANVAKSAAAPSPVSVGLSPLLLVATSPNSWNCPSVLNSAD